MSGLDVVPSRTGYLLVSNVLSTRASRGPRFGLRPVCCASIWYIGLPRTRGQTRATPQHEKILGSNQVPNSAGIVARLPVHAEVAHEEEQRRCISQAPVRIWLSASNWPG